MGNSIVTKWSGHAMVAIPAGKIAVMELLLDKEGNF